MVEAERVFKILCVSVVCYAGSLSGERGDGCSLDESMASVWQWCQTRGGRSTVPLHLLEFRKKKGRTTLIHHEPGGERRQSGASLMSEIDPDIYGLSNPPSELFFFFIFFSGRITPGKPSRFNNSQLRLCTTPPTGEPPVARGKTGLGCSIVVSKANSLSSHDLTSRHNNGHQNLSTAVERVGKQDFTQLQVPIARILVSELPPLAPPQRRSSRIIQFLRARSQTSCVPAVLKRGKPAEEKEGEKRVGFWSRRWGRGGVCFYPLAAGLRGDLELRFRDRPFSVAAYRGNWSNLQAR